MKVTDQQSSQQYTQFLAEKQKNKIQARQQELQNLDKFYDQKIQNVKIDGIKKMSQERDHINKELEENHLQLSDKLQESKKMNDMIRSNLDQERKMIQNLHQAQIKDIRFKNDEKFQNLLSNTQEISQDLEEKTKNQIKQIQTDAHQQVLNQQVDTSHKITQSINESDQKLKDQKDQFKTEVDRQIRDQKKEKASTQLDHHRFIGQLKNKQFLEKTQIQTLHAKDLEHEDQKFKDALMQMNESFQKKYELMTKEQAEILARVDQNFKQQLQKSMEDQGRLKEVYESKSKDEFYQLSKLAPHLEDKPDHYILNLQIPEHEHEAVRVTTHRKTITLGLARKFEDKTTSLDGSSNESKRSEIYTKRLEVPEFVSSKNIERKYENGVLSFKIKKDA